MKFYHKKLRNIEKLKKERKRLLQEREALEDDGLFSMSALTGKDDHNGKVKAGSGLMDMLQPSNPLVQGLVAILKSKLEQKSKAPKENPTEGSPVKSKVIGVVKDIAFSYAKWKAIELSYKGIKFLIKLQKTKSQEEQNTPS